MLTYPAILAGHTYIHEAAADPLLAELVNTFLTEDVAPWLCPPPGVSLPAYVRQVLMRFSNRALPDTVVRVAGDGAAKLPAFVRETSDALLRGGDVRRLALLVATFRSYVAVTKREATESRPNRTCATATGNYCGPPTRWTRCMRAPSRPGDWPTTRDSWRLTRQLSTLSTLREPGGALTSSYTTRGRRSEPGRQPPRHAHPQHSSRGQRSGWACSAPGRGSVGSVPRA
ncbi:hypothetical protein [Streptomyces anthocyanicus]|uniref:mannitol dehydrogenase family protein n=1 Tax=Streptomyces anthocyanicus TaxID=68174 RepID=UPI0038665BD9